MQRQGPRRRRGVGEVQRELLRRVPPRRLVESHRHHLQVGHRPHARPECELTSTCAAARRKRPRHKGQPRRSHGGVLWPTAHGFAAWRARRRSRGRRGPRGRRPARRGSRAGLGRARGRTAVPRSSSWRGTCPAARERTSFRESCSRSEAQPTARGGRARSPSNRASRHLWLVDRRDRLRVLRQSARPDPAELRRVEPGKLHERDLHVASLVQQFRAHRLDEALDAVLCSAVARLQRDSAARERRADLHDLPAVAGLHPRERRHRAVDAPEERDLDDTPELVGLGVP